jgi:hypothetical protein
MLSYDAHKRCSKTTIHVQFSLQKYLDSYNLESHNINLKCHIFFVFGNRLQVQKDVFQVSM